MKISKKGKDAYFSITLSFIKDLWRKFRCSRGLMFRIDFHKFIKSTVWITWEIQKIQSPDFGIELESMRYDYNQKLL